MINLDQASRDMEDAVTAYLRRATETFDLSKNVEVSYQAQMIQTGCSLLFSFLGGLFTNLGHPL